jgi:hypothetical protein
VGGHCDDGTQECNSGVGCVDCLEPTDCESGYVCNDSKQCELDVPCTLNISETLDDCTPSGWSRDSDWDCNNFNNYTGGSGKFFIIFGWNIAEPIDQSVATQQYNAAGCSTVSLGFLHAYDDDNSTGSDFGYVDISLNNGASWSHVHTFSSDNDVAQNFDLGKSGWPTDNFKIRFRYVSPEDEGRSWAIDNITLVGAD